VIQRDPRGHGIVAGRDVDCQKSATGLNIDRTLHPPMPPEAQAAHALVSAGPMSVLLSALAP
jgi:hypothetical protein